MDSRKAAAPASAKDNITFLPSAVLVSKDGKLAAVNTRGGQSGSVMEPAPGAAEKSGGALTQ